MYRYEISYTEHYVDATTQVASTNQVLKPFFAPAEPKEISLRKYQKMLLSIVDMPLFVRVLLGFVDKKNMPIENIEERFDFSALSPKDLAVLYDAIEGFLLTVFHNETIEQTYELITPKDLLFLRDYLTDSQCENFSYKFYSYFCKIIADTFLAVSDKCFYEKRTIEGKNVFEVRGRKFFLPAQAVSNFINSKGVQYKISKQELDSLVAAELADGSQNIYSTWQATTAIDFYTLSQNFDIIHNGNEISHQKLNDGNKIAFENSAAAIFASLAREIKGVSQNGKIELKKREIMDIEELQKHTLSLISFFNDHLTMDEVHQCSFFFANFTQRTENFINLHT